MSERPYQYTDKGRGPNRKPRAVCRNGHDQAVWRRSSLQGSRCHRCFLDAHRRWTIVNVYHSTPEEYDALLARQGGVCAICGTDKWSPNGKKEWPCIDHDHATGKVRGLLCTNCNTVLGLLKDNPATAQRVIEYLKGASYGGIGTEVREDQNRRSEGAPAVGNG